jgi:hypothetical protein
MEGSSQDISERRFALFLRFRCVSGSGRFRAVDTLGEPPWRIALRREKNVISAVQESAKPRFWRDDALAFIEVRSIENAGEVHYAKHAHETFSIGAITAGSCTYLNGRARQRINAGSVVLMNPGDVHACRSATAPVK